MKAKRFLAMLLMGCLAVLTLFSFVGCGYEPETFEYLTKKMNEFPIEYPGYQLVKDDRPDESMMWYDGTGIVRGETAEMWCGNVNAEVTYRGETREITPEFIRERNETYRKILQIWGDEEGQAKATRMYSVYAYDDELFILTEGIQIKMMSETARNMTPITLYHYDWETDIVKYAGFYDKYKKEGLKIINIEE